MKTPQGTESDLYADQIVCFQNIIDILCWDDGWDPSMFWMD